MAVGPTSVAAVSDQVTELNYGLSASCCRHQKRELGSTQPKGLGLPLVAEHDDRLGVSRQVQWPSTSQFSCRIPNRLAMRRTGLRGRTTVWNLVERVANALDRLLLKKRP